MEKLIDRYNKEILPKLKSDLKRDNIFEVPAIEKVVVSAGVGDFKEDKGAIERIIAEMAIITGQHPKTNLSRKAVSAFKLRVGQPVGLTVTLRGKKMFDFLDRLINIALPRVRDFKGTSTKAFDGNGNYSIGLRDHTIFPEVKYEEVDKSFGLQVNIKTSAKNNEDAKALLVMIGIPFEKKLQTGSLNK